jgi:hypothetical protein
MLNLSKSFDSKGFSEITRLRNDAVWEHRAARLKARPEIFGRRRQIEHSFGSITDG